MIYVINLKRDKRRLSSFFKRIRRYDKNIIRFNAVDGHNYTEVQKSIKEYDLDEEKIKKLWQKNAGSIGCYLSHLRLWNYLLRNSKQEFCFIMEDDAYLLPKSLWKIKNILKIISKAKWDILYIGHNSLYGVNLNSFLLKPFPTERKGYNTGLYGYIVRKSSLEKLIRLVKTFDSSFIDIQMKLQFGDGPDKISALFIREHLIRHSINVSSRQTLDRVVRGLHYV
jgi:glycosyl transferase family 25